MVAGLPHPAITVGRSRGTRDSCAALRCIQPGMPPVSLFPSIPPDRRPEPRCLQAEFSGPSEVFSGVSTRKGHRLGRAGWGWPPQKPPEPHSAGALLGVLDPPSVQGCPWLGRNSGGVLSS